MPTAPRPKGPAMKIFRTRICAERRGFVFMRDNPRLSASYFLIRVAELVVNTCRITTIDMGG